MSWLRKLIALLMPEPGPTIEQAAAYRARRCEAGCPRRIAR